MRLEPRIATKVTNALEPEDMDPSPDRTELIGIRPASLRHYMIAVAYRVVQGR